LLEKLVLGIRREYRLMPSTNFSAGFHEFLDIVRRNPSGLSA